MGDGSLVEMTRSEIKADLEAGTQLAAKKAKVPELTQDELDHLLDIYASAARFTAVDIGDEVVLSNDGTGTKHIGNRVQDLQSYEALSASTWSSSGRSTTRTRPSRPTWPTRGRAMKIAQTLLTNPVQYGAMPDLGRYSKPDGPIPNWSELLPLGKIDEARQAQEEAAAMLVDDIEFVADHMVAAGTDGIDFDTTGAAGDADFLAGLTACRRLREKYPWLGIEIGMASEFVLGMHGQLDVRRRAPRRHVAQGPAAHGPGGRRQHLRAGRQHQHGQVDGLEHRSGDHLHQARHGDRRDPGARQRGHGRGRRADLRVPAGRRHLERASKAFVEILKIDGY